MIRTAFAFFTAFGLLAAGAPALANQDHLRDDGSLRFRFYTDWELLYVDRDGTASVEVSFRDELPPPRPSPVFRDVLDTDDVVDDDEEFGGRGVLGVRIDETSAVELVFIGFGHDRKASVLDLNSDLFAFENPDAGLLPGVDDGEFDNAVFHELDYDSEFYSGEINYRHAFAVDGTDYRFNLLAGIRAVRLEEDMNLTSIENFGAAGVPDPSLGFGTYDIETRNSMIGIQLGGEAEIPLIGDHVELDLYAVAGLFANRAVVRNEMNDVDATPFSFRESREDWDDAGLLEGAAHLNIRLIRGIELKLGYRALYVMNVATAPLQFPRAGGQDFFGNIFDNDDKTLFHGPSLGLKVAF